MSCPRCGPPNPPVAKFCSNCGASLELRCPACGHVNAPGGRFCNECGEALRPAVRGAPPAYTPEPLAARILTPPGAPEGGRKHLSLLLADPQGSLELPADPHPQPARPPLDPLPQPRMEAV